LAMFVSVKIWDCHGNRLRTGLAVCMPLTEAWTSTSLTGRSGQIVTLSDENRGTSGVRSPDEHSNKSRTTSFCSGSSCAVWVSSGGTGFPTVGGCSFGRVVPPSQPRHPGKLLNVASSAPRSSSRTCAAATGKQKTTRRQPAYRLEVPIVSHRVPSNERSFSSVSRSDCIQRTNRHSFVPAIGSRPVRRATERKAFRPDKRWCPEYSSEPS